jgi:hypothetical protein
MVTDADPLLNVSAVSVDVIIAPLTGLLLADNAIWAELIVIGPPVVVYLLEKCTRILFPPSVACTT